METASDTTSNLTVRGMPTWVRAKLAARAKEQHMSLNSYLLEMLAKHAESPTMAEVLARIDSRGRPYGITSDEAQAALQAIRAERDE